VRTVSKTERPTREYRHEHLSEGLQQSFKNHRGRTLALCDEIASCRTASGIAFRPAPGRRIWPGKLMHIGVTARAVCLRAAGARQKPGKWTELWQRFPRRQQPDDNIRPGRIRELLAVLATSGGWENLAII